MLATSRRLSDTIRVAKVLTPAQRQKLGTEIDRMMAAHRASSRRLIHLSTAVAAWRRLRATASLQCPNAS